MLFALRNWNGLPRTRYDLLQLADMQSDPLLAALRDPLHEDIKPSAFHGIVGEDSILKKNSWLLTTPADVQAVAPRSCPPAVGEHLGKPALVRLGSAVDQARLLRYVQKFANAGVDLHLSKKVKPFEPLIVEDFLELLTSVTLDGNGKTNLVKHEPFLLNLLDHYRVKLPVHVSTKVLEQFYETEKADAEAAALTLPADGPALDQEAAGARNRVLARFLSLPRRDLTTHTVKKLLEEAELEIVEGCIAINSNGTTTATEYDTAATSAAAAAQAGEVEQVVKGTTDKNNSTATFSTTTRRKTSSCSSPRTVASLSIAKNPFKLRILRGLYTQPGAWNIERDVTMRIWKHAGIDVDTPQSQLALAALKLFDATTQMHPDHIDAILSTKNTDLMYHLLDTWDFPISHDQFDELLNFDWCFGLQPCTKLTSSACTKLTSSAMSASSSAVAVFSLDAVPVGVLPSPVVGSCTSARAAGVAAALVTGEEQGRGNNDGSTNSMPTATTRSTGAAEEACCGTTTSPPTYYYTNRAGGIKVIAKLLTKWQPNLTAEQAAGLRRRYADSPVSDWVTSKYGGGGLSANEVMLLEETTQGGPEVDGLQNASRQHQQPQVEPQPLGETESKNQGDGGQVDNEAAAADVWTVSSSGDETGSREDWDMIPADGSSLDP
ncbi:unnamed protein product [Amoebophrya sp. A120]|nr:unnamed protein product [Amoebophrya sp. A120]|eukprot:GSA120T00005878001.1